MSEAQNERADNTHDELRRLETLLARYRREKAALLARVDQRIAEFEDLARTVWPAARELFNREGPEAVAEILEVDQDEPDDDVFRRMILALRDGLTAGEFIDTERLLRGAADEVSIDTGT